MPTQFNPSTVKVAPDLLISSTGCACYLHKCISSFESLAVSEVNMQQYITLFFLTNAHLTYFCFTDFFFFFFILPFSDPLFYRLEDRMLTEEDSQHEFKCHLAICKEDLPPWAQSAGHGSKKSISRSLNALLNGEKGGTVYLGVANNGIISGVKLSLFQKDHLKVNLDNLMKRYKPCVNEDRYSIHFVLAVDSEKSEDDVISMYSSLKTEQESIEKTIRQKAHLCQTYELCWCFKGNHSEDIPDMLFLNYVVKIEIKPWDMQHMVWNYMQPCVNIQPLYSNEEGMVFVRGLGSDRLCEEQEIVHMTRQKVAQFYKMRIEKIQEQIKQLLS